MALHRALVALLLVTLPLAGCLSGEDGGEVDAATTNDTDLNTAAPEGRGPLVAFEETNQTEEGSGGVDHHHDYWQGRTRVTIFEMESMMRPMGAEETLDYEAVATFRPPQGTFVYERTAQVDFTIENPRRHVCEGEFTLGGFYVCTDTLDEYGAQGQRLPEVPSQPDPTGGSDGLKLRYKHASTTNWIDAGQLVWGQPTIIKITDPIQTDMPHATSSAWEFQVVSPHKEDTTLVFDAKAEMVRGEGDIPLWPGHPNFYADATSRKVIDNLQVKVCDPGFTGAGCALVDGQARVQAQKLISYGTRSLHVWINISDFQAPNPATAPDNLFLWHWNSTGRDNITSPFDREGHPLSETNHYWVIPVDDNGMDSPYADGSRWHFQLGAAFYKATLSCYGGCAEWSATYTITAIATNQTLPTEAYDWECLRDDYCPSPDEGSDDGGDERRSRMYVRDA